MVYNEQMVKMLSSRSCAEILGFLHARIITRALPQNTNLMLQDWASGTVLHDVQERQKWFAEAQQAAQLRAALEDAQIQSKKDILKAQTLREETEQLHQDLEVSNQELGKWCTRSHRLCWQSKKPLHRIA